MVGSFRSLTWRKAMPKSWVRSRSWHNHPASFCVAARRHFALPLSTGLILPGRRLSSCIDQRDLDSAVTDRWRFQPSWRKIQEPWWRNPLGVHTASTPSGAGIVGRKVRLPLGHRGRFRIDAPSEPGLGMCRQSSRFVAVAPLSMCKRWRRMIASHASPGRSSAHPNFATPPVTCPEQKRIFE